MEQGQFRYLLAFGSNLGDRHRNLDEALRCLSSVVLFLAHSRRLETEPLTSEMFDVSDHGPYLNMVAEARSALAPQALYECICEVEDFLGHPRDARWRPRAMDVDILLCALEPADRPVQVRRFEECVPLCMSPSSANPEALRIPHVGLFSRPFLRELLVDDLKLPQAWFERQD